jgi:hypothetical protein
VAGTEVEEVVDTVASVEVSIVAAVDVEVEEVEEDVLRLSRNTGSPNA